jgi:hypothetical protein
MIIYPKSWENGREAELIEEELLMMETLKHEKKIINELYWQNIDFLKNIKIPFIDKINLAYEHAKEGELIAK